MGAARAIGNLPQRLRMVRERIAQSALDCGRSADEITLVAVSKTHPAEMVRAAIAAGLTEFGENRVQEAEGKIPEIHAGKTKWHLIGHLQSNKARRAVELFDLIHSLDSAALARRLDRICIETNRPDLPVLLQVDLGHEPTKTGAPEADLPEIVEAVRQSQCLSLIGLMTVPPFFDQAEKTRPYFRRLRKIRDRLRNGGAFKENQGELSMGMTHDYEIAIQEGATMLRIGTAIFGERE